MFALNWCAYILCQLPVFFFLFQFPPPPPLPIILAYFLRQSLTSTLSALTDPPVPSLPSLVVWYHSFIHAFISFRLRAFSLLLVVVKWWRVQEDRANWAGGPCVVYVSSRAGTVLQVLERKARVCVFLCFLFVFCTYIHLHVHVERFSALLSSCRIFGRGGWGQVGWFVF